MSKTLEQRLDHITSLSGKRTPDVLTTFPGGYAQGWRMEIPDAFADNLDMVASEKIIDGEKQIVWTQGSQFRFKEGDLLYDSKNGYQAIWKESLLHITLCVQVAKATPATPGSPRDPGVVEFRVLRPNADKTKLIPQEMVRATQDSFVRFLLTGSI